MASAPRAGKEPEFRAQMKGWRTSLLSGGCLWDPNSLPGPHFAPPLRAGSQRACVPDLPLPLLLRLPELIDHEGDTVCQPHGGDAARGKAGVSGHTRPLLPGCRGPHRPIPTTALPCPQTSPDRAPRARKRVPKSCGPGQGPLGNTLPFCSEPPARPGLPPRLTAACTALPSGARPGPDSAQCVAGE